MLSEFSTAAGDFAGSLEELAAGTQLEKAAPILEQLETIAQELAKQIDGITVEALRRQAKGWTNIMGLPVDKTMSSGHLTNVLMGAQIWAANPGAVYSGIRYATHHTDS
jgi:hypothetical protein